MNSLKSNVKKSDQISCAPIHYDGSNATDVVIVLASCTDQQRASTASTDMEQRVVEVVPSIVNAERNKRRFFVLDDADIQQYLDSEGGLNVGERDAMDEYLGIEVGGAYSGISKDNILSSVAGTSKCFEGFEGFEGVGSDLDVQKPLINGGRKRDKRTDDGCSRFVKASDGKRHWGDEYACGESNVYQCPGCKRLYTGMRSLRIHMGEAGAKKNLYLCSECDLDLFCQPNLKIHMNEVHTKEFMFMCSKCPRGFIVKARLQYHRMQEHGEYMKFYCAMCKIIFNGKYNQDIHNASNGHLEKMVEKEREEGVKQTNSQSPQSPQSHYVDYLL